jgi:TonB family protein
MRFRRAALGVCGTLVFASCSATGPSQQTDKHVVAPHVVVHVNPRYDVLHPARIGSDYYPPASRRLGEQGSNVVNITLAPDGTVENVEILVSTGYPRLDAATLAGLKPGKFLPATDDGKPVRATFKFRVTWVLAPAQPQNQPLPISLG